MKSTDEYDANPEPAEEGVETFHRWSLMAVYIMGRAMGRALPIARQMPLLAAALNRGLVSIKDVSAAATAGWWPARIIMAGETMRILEHQVVPDDAVLDWMADVFCEYADPRGRPVKATMDPVPGRIRRAMNTILAEDVDAEAAALEGAERLPGDPSPRQQAIEIVAERYLLKPRQVENRLADFRKEGAPRSTTSSSVSPEVH